MRLSSMKTLVFCCRIAVTILCIVIGTMWGSDSDAHAARIGIVSLSCRSDIDHRWTFITKKYLQDYAEQHCYSFYYYTHLFDTVRSPIWSKILALRYVVDQAKHDWVVFFDDDIRVTNPQFRLEDVIEQYGHDKALIMGTDIGRTLGDGNAGIMILRADQSGRDLLDQIYRAGEIFHYTHAALPLQRTICILVQLDENFKAKIALTPPRLLQSYVLEPVARWDVLGESKRVRDEWQMGDFCAHACASSTEVRLAIMDHFEQLIAHTETEIERQFYGS